jgi:hypothetical protein
MTSCASNADCLSLLYINGNTSLPNWCVKGVNCDSIHLACVTWPRCRSWPGLGCLAATQECVHTRNEHFAITGANTTTVSHYATLNSPVVILSLILGSLLFVVGLVAFIVTAWHHCHPSSSSSSRRKQREARIPLVTIDAFPADYVIHPHQQEEDQKEEDSATLTRLYNESSLVY